MKFLIALAAFACVASAFVVEQDEVLLLPSQPPELPLNDTDFAFNNDLIKGNASLIGCTVYGLDTLEDTLVFNLLGLSLSGDVTLAAAQIKGNYLADGTLTFSNGTTVRLLGDGTLDAAGTVLKVTGLKIVFNVNLITQRISIKSIEFTPSIESCTISTTGDSANGQPIDWVTTCKDIPALVDEFWPIHKESLYADIILIGNELLKDVTLQDLIDLIGGGGSGSGSGTG
jgi:hypothetical protein